MIISICAVCTLLAVCIMVGCEKPLMVNEETEVVKGNLTVMVFEIAKTPFESFTRGIEPASARCTRLNFAVYDEDGTRRRATRRDSVRHHSSWKRVTIRWWLWGIARAATPR